MGGPRQMGARPLKLVSCDAADAAFTIAALIADADPPFRSVLVVGADIKTFVKALAIHVPRLALIGHLLTPGDVVIPYADRQFDLVIDLDFLALLPVAQRSVFYRELVRVADRECVAAEPLGTDLQVLIDRSLINLYGELFRAVHTELTMIVDYGLPNPHQASSWLRHGEDADMFYAGDVVAYQQTAELLIRRAHQRWWSSLFGRVSPHAHSLSEPALRQPDTVPRRRHRRLFLFFRRI
jgi:hypothetical protein